MAEPSRAPRRINLSKSIIETWHRCRLAYRYERVDRLPPDDEPSRALIMGGAAHEAVAALLKAGIDPDSGGALERIEEVTDGYALDDADADKVSGWAVTAARYALDRGGTLRWIESLLVMQRLREIPVWGKFDAAIVGGSVAPLEVIDWKFGRAHARTPEDLAASVGPHVYRLLAGHCEPDATLRPIAITEFHVPSGTEVTISPADDAVEQWWSELKDVAAEIRTAHAADTFPATPGIHCAWCSYRDRCPVAGAVSDQPPL